MKINLKNILRAGFPKIILLFLIAFTTDMLAHCDSMEGPVVKAAIKSLETGNINYVLIWIPEDDEPELRRLFDKVLRNRNLNAEVRELTETYFYETVVRIHRMGEGVGYTGLKTTDFKPEEGIEAADIAVEKNSVDEILTHLKEDQHLKVKELFADLQQKKNFNTDDVIKGREFVAAYVHFIHFVEEQYSDENHEVKSCH